MYSAGEETAQGADRRWFVRETLVFFGLVGALFLASLLVLDRYLPLLVGVVFALTSGGPLDAGLLGWTGLRVLSALALWLLGLYAGAAQAKRWGTTIRALRRKYRAPLRAQAPLSPGTVRRVMPAPPVARGDEARRPSVAGPRH